MRRLSSRVVLICSDPDQIVPDAAPAAAESAEEEEEGEGCDFLEE